jgi:hypothetical protein
MRDSGAPGAGPTCKRRRQIEHTIPESKNQRADRQDRGGKGGRPTDFDTAICKDRNDAERTINALKNFRVMATRFDKRVCVLHGTVAVIRRRLRYRCAG